MIGDEHSLMKTNDCFQATEEKREMDALQHSNKRILFNLLPAHVATHFLDNQFRSNMVNTPYQNSCFIYSYLFNALIFSIKVLKKIK